MLSYCDHIDENLQKRVLGVRDDKSLMVIEGEVENPVRERNNLTVGILTLFCLDKT